MFPEGFIYEENGSLIQINQQGLYFVKVFGLEEEINSILIDDEEREFNNEFLIRLNKGSRIVVPSQGDQIIIHVHKI